MVAAFDFCLHGKGGAAPSIDTAMHGLVDAAHVDHLHPDSGIAIATAADGEELTKEIFGGRARSSGSRGVGPASSSASTSPTIKADNPQAVGCILGGHGITAWGDTSDEAEAQLALDHRHRRGVHRRAQQGRAVRSRARRVRRSAGAPSAAPRPRRSRRPSAASRRRTAPMVGHFTDSSSRPRLPRRGEHPRLAELGTSCPDHFLRTKVKPLVLDLPADAHGRGVVARLQRARGAYRADYQAYYDRHATPTPRRSAAPTR